MEEEVEGWSRWEGEGISLMLPLSYLLLPPPSLAAASRHTALGRPVLISAHRQSGTHKGATQRE